MPEQQFKTLVEILGLNGVVSMLGGLIKVSFNISRDGFTWFTAFRMIFISTLFGSLAGGVSREFGMELYSTLCISTVVSILAYNLAEAVEKLGFKQVLQMIVDRGYDQSK